MNFPSNMLSIFAQHDGNILPDDGVIEVPATLAPVAMVPEPQRMFTFGTFDTVAKRTSFACTSQQTVANGAINDQAVAVLAPGLWHVTILANYVANYNNQADFGEVYISDSTGITNTGHSLWRIRAQTLANDSFSIRYWVSNPLAEYCINTFLSANGVGESHSIDVNVMANRVG